MTPLAFSVLRRLSDGEFHSGEAIARDLGVSRGSVWNALRSAEEAGIRVFKIRGRGYCLPDDLDWLDREQVLESAREHAEKFQIEIHDRVSSTSTLLLERGSCETSGKVVAAELQTAGRGRRGRAWRCGLGEGVTFSLLWRFDQGPAFLAGLSLAVGVGLTRAFDELGAGGTRLKWPNDVLHEGGKLAGTLIELEGEMQGPSAAVIGIGINVRLGGASRRSVDQPVADLASAGGGLSRSRVLGVVLGQLARVLRDFESCGFEPFVEPWITRHAYQDSPVSLLLPDGGVLEGTARGVDRDGALLLQTRSGIRRLFGGEVSLRVRP